MTSFAQLEVPAPQAGVILKHKVGSGARGLLDYAASKATDINGVTTNKAIYSNVSETPRSIAKEFGFLRRLRPRLNQAVGHLIIAPKSKFQTQADWERAANIAMQEHGIENTAFASYLHTDTEHPHLHIVYSRIRFDASVVSDSNSYRTNERAARKIESAFGIPALQTRPHENRPIDSQRAYSAGRREERVRVKTNRKDQENARNRHITHAPKNKPNRSNLRKSSEIGLRHLYSRPLAHNRDAEFESLLPDNERAGGRESGYVRWGGPGDNLELIRVIPQQKSTTTRDRRIKMTTQTEFQKIDAIAKKVLKNPAVDSPVEFKRRLDAALAEAEIEAHVRFHRRGREPDAEISGWSLMFSQGTSVAASNINRSLSWAHVLAELNANAARRRQQDESAQLAEEALGFLLRPAQTAPAPVVAEHEPAPHRVAGAEQSAEDASASCASWYWPDADEDGICETRTALKIKRDFITRLTPAQLETLVCKLLDRAEKKWGEDSLQADGPLVDHPALRALLVEQAAKRPGLRITQPPELAADIEAARVARAAAGLSPAAPVAPLDLDFLSFSSAEAPPVAAPAPAVVSAPAPVLAAAAPLGKAEAEKAKTAELIAELRARVEHARLLFAAPVPQALSPAALARLDAPALRARLIELRGSSGQAEWVQAAAVRHAADRHRFSGKAAERVLEKSEADSRMLLGVPAATEASRSACTAAAKALAEARAGLDRAGPFRWLSSVARRAELDRLEADALSSRALWEQEKSKFLLVHAEEINRFGARQTCFFTERQLLASHSHWTPDFLDQQVRQTLDRLAVEEQKEHGEVLRKQERERLSERALSGGQEEASSHDEEQQRVRYERQR